MANYFQDSDVNTFQDSDVNFWSDTVFYEKTKVSVFWEDLYIHSLEVTLISEEIYFFAVIIISEHEELYSLRIGAVFEEYYGDVPFPLAIFEDYYGDTVQPLKAFIDFYDDAHMPVKLSEELYGDVPTPTNVSYGYYGDAPVIKSIHEELYSILYPIVAVFVDSYSLTESTITAVFEEYYDLRENNQVIAVFEDFYHLLSETTIMDTPTASMILAGEEIDFMSMNLSASMSQYCITCTIGLATEAEYLKCSYLSEVVCTINSIEFNLFVEDRPHQSSNADVHYTISLMSPTVKLGAPYSLPLVESFPDGIWVNDLVDQMAATQDIAVDYQILDWFLPDYAISINDETPLEVIRRVVQSIKGVVQTKPNGDLLIISKYPDSPVDWVSLSPSIIYSSDSNTESISETLKVNSGHNAYVVTSSGSSSKNITLEEEDINNDTKLIRGFRVPFDDGPFELATSGGSIVSIEKYALPVEELRPVDEEWEIVEFIDWTGSTTNPIYAVADWDWIEEDLGAFQISEDGTLTIIDQTSVPSESLLRIRYMTKFWLWTVRCGEDKNVQFYVPEEE